MSSEASEPDKAAVGNPISISVWRALLDLSLLEPATISAAQARIWWAIDELLKNRTRAMDQASRIAILESLSREIHVARHQGDLGRTFPRIAALTDEWLSCATLH